MSDLRTVYHNGMALLASQLVLEELGLKAGQRITQDQVFEVIRGNAGALVADIELRKAAGEKGLPDTTGLQRKLSR